MRHLAITSISTAARVLTFSLEVGSFFLQFLDWWYAHGGGSGPGKDHETSVLIPAPPPPVTGKNDRYRASIKRKTFQVDTND